jgi:hypothetical protein
MEGGIAILLLLIIAVVVGGIALLGFFGGGALSLSKDDEGGGRFSRPKHKRVTSETIENTELVGTRSDDEPR